MEPKANAGVQEEVTDDKGGQDVSENEENKENNNDGSEQEEGADSVGGTEAEENGEAGNDGEEDGKEDEGNTQSGLVARLEAIEKENRELRERISKPQEQRREKTEEEWQIEEANTGMSRTAIQSYDKKINEMANHLSNKIDQVTAKYEKESVLSSMSQQKDFKDIQQFRKGIDEHLSRYPSQYHSNQKLITDGYYISKGKGLGSTVKKVMNNNEINRKIISKNKLPYSKSGGGGGNKGFQYKLTPTEKSTYEAFGKNIFKSEEDFAKSLKRNRGK